MIHGLFAKAKTQTTLLEPKPDSSEGRGLAALVS